MSRLSIKILNTSDKDSKLLDLLSFDNSHFQNYTLYNLNLLAELDLKAHQILELQIYLEDTQLRQLIDCLIKKQTEWLFTIKPKIESIFYNSSQETANMFIQTLNLIKESPDSQEYILLLEKQAKTQKLEIHNLMSTLSEYIDDLNQYLKQLKLETNRLKQHLEQDKLKALKIQEIIRQLQDALIPYSKDFEFDLLNETIKNKQIFTNLVKVTLLTANLSIDLNILGLFTEDYLLIKMLYEDHKIHHLLTQLTDSENQLIDVQTDIINLTLSIETLEQILILKTQHIQLLNTYNALFWGQLEQKCHNLKILSSHYRGDFSNLETIRLIPDAIKNWRKIIQIIQNAHYLHNRIKLQSITLKQPTNKL